MDDGGRNEGEPVDEGQARDGRGRYISVNSARERRLFREMLRREADRENREYDRRSARRTILQGVAIGIVPAAVVNIPWASLWLWLTRWLHQHTGP